MTVPHFDQWLGAYFKRDTDHGATGSRVRPSIVDASQSPVAPAAHLGDAELVTAIRAGDAARFTAWYDAIYNDAWRFARRFSADADQASDVVQDVFLSIWKRRTTWDVRGPVHTYVLGAIRRRALQSLRHDRIVQTATDRAIDPTGTPEGGFGMGATPHAPDARVTEDSLHEAMRRHIAQLPERQRTALVLRWEHELSNVEIAGILGIGEAAVSRLLARATATLRQVWDALTG